MRTVPAEETLGKKRQMAAGVAVCPSSSCWTVGVIPRGAKAPCDHGGSSEHQSWVEHVSSGHPGLPQPWTAGLLVALKGHKRNENHMKIGLGTYRVYGLSGNVKEVTSLQDTVMMTVRE